MISKIYRRIAQSGERQPTIEQVRMALGPSSPGLELLRRWRSPKSESIPSFEQLLYLLAKAEAAGPPEPLFRMGAYMKWCRAADAQWSGKPSEQAAMSEEVDAP